MNSLPIFSALCGLAASLAMADAGDWMSVQGLLQQADGLSYADGDYNLCFSLHTGASGGDSLWEECKKVPVEDGLYHAVLGDVIPLPLPSLHANWLGIKVEGTSLSGRLPVTGGNRAYYAQTSLHSDSALFSRLAVYSDTAAFSLMAAQALRSQSALRSDSSAYSDSTLYSRKALYSDTAVHSQGASLVQDSVAEGARLGKGIAVRSLNGLRDEVVLEAEGSVILSQRGDTLRLMGREDFDSTAQAQLAQAQTWIKSHEGAFLKSSGEYTMKFIPSHHNETGYFTTPTCTSVAEGKLYYYGKTGGTNTCGLRLCVYTGDASQPYAWKSLSLQ